MKILKTLIIFSAITFLFILLSSLIHISKEPSIKSQIIPINYTNFEKEISKNEMINAIPKNIGIILRFYNSKTPKRTLENSYLLTTEKVQKTKLTSSDIILSIDSKYLSELTNRNLCYIIQKANKNGDLNFETHLSKTSLAWKFKAMYNYKGCLGL